MSKNFGSRFAVKSAIFCCILLGSSVAPLGAQGDGAAAAGGNWSVYGSEDRMTAARRVRFELMGNNDLREARPPRDNPPPPPPPPPYGRRAPRRPPDDDRQAEPAPPRIEIYCENGHYKGSNFYPGVRMAPPNRPGFWGQPQMQVRIRVNDAHRDHGWNWTPDFLAMDKETTRELIGAQLLRVEFLGYGGPVIAEFSPAGLDLRQVATACELKPKKP